MNVVMAHLQDVVTCYWDLIKSLPVYIILTICFNKTLFNGLLNYFKKI